MRVFGHYVLDSRVRLFVAEQAAAGVLFLAALASGGLGGAEALGAALLSVLALQGALYLADLYDPRDALPQARWLVAAGLGVVGASGAWAIAGSSAPGFWLAAVALATLVVFLLRGLALSRPRRAVVLGNGPIAREVSRRLRDTQADCVAVGFLPDGTTDDGGPTLLPLLLDRGGEVDLVAERMNAELVIVATDGPLPEEALARARANGVEVVSAAGFTARYLRRLPPELLGRAELAYGEGFEARRITDYTIRALDFLAAATLLVLAAPVLLLAIVAIRLDSRGPAFYSQERVGRGGRTYRVTKLRSMRVDAEASGTPQWATQNDPRVTRVGAFLRKTRIDEIPQVFAVLAGHMSLVGPRPERPFFVEQLKAQIPLYALREVVRPGVTGWAQIGYPYGATIEDARNKLEFDLYWIRHRSVFLYLSVLFHTVRTVLTGRGAR